MSADLTVTEYTDPACPWAWGSEPKFRGLRELLATAGDAVVWRRVYGILFDEGEQPPPDPAAEAAWYLEELARDLRAHRRAVPGAAGVGRGHELGRWRSPRRPRSCRGRA